MSGVSTHDLRSNAKDYQRDRNHNAKWARGTAPPPGKTCHHSDVIDLDSYADYPKRPLHRDASRRCGRHYTDNTNKKLAVQKANMARKMFRNEVVEATDAPATSASDSSGEEDVVDASAAPVPDADIMYSYDASHGPGRGADVLSHAVNQAVLRYENKETEKLAKEYDMVGDIKEHNEGYAADADEDDYEMIDHAHLE